MFKEGSYIIYGASGVCKVERVGKLDITGIPADKDYYTLAPVYASGMIYTPIDNTAIVMRDVISKEEAKKFLNSIEEIEAVWDDSDKVREEMYKTALKSCELSEMIKIMKTLNKIKVMREANGKKVTNSDEKYFTTACDKVCGEIAISLDMDKQDVVSKVVGMIEAE